MALPLLFTLPPSNRHELILLDPSSKPSLKALNKQITSTIASSPNCAECTSFFSLSLSLSLSFFPLYLLHPILPLHSPPNPHPDPKLTTAHKVMGKYKAADGPAERIEEFKMHWNPKERDPKIWPEHTIVTEENFGAILEVLKLSPASGVLEVKVGKPDA
jgi:hypothetical protein